MSTKFYSYLLLCLLFVSSACIREEFKGNTPQSNFEALWNIIDSRYCFLDYKKQEYGLDWDNIHQTYRKRLTDKMSNEALFEVLSEMVNELHDGHVNLTSAYGSSQYREWFDAYPHNFSDSIQSRYLRKDYVISSGLIYQILPNNIGYIYIGSFSNAIGDGNLDQTLLAMKYCNGIIIDVRDNGGGDLTTAQKVAARFTNERVHVGYIAHKTGAGHNDFSDRIPVYINPSTGVRWQKKVVVLTNRRSYSATNDFANAMRQMPQATLVGDKTGGGSGLPFSAELPNGWTIRFSAGPMWDANNQQIEFGVAPDIKVDISQEDYAKGIDTIIEKAIEVIESK